MGAAVHKAQGKGSAVRITRRDRMIIDRQRAHALREKFPNIDQVRVRLVFTEPEPRIATPSPQAHTFYPAAAAFFRFPCPCADCDGDFDLTDAVTQLTLKSATRGRSTSASGQLSCQGIRFRDHASHQSSCVMQLEFSLSADPAGARPR